MKNTKKIYLSIIVPCYNEEKRFQEGISHYLKYLKYVNYTWVLILVNDGSKDDTPKLMKKIQNKSKEIKVISYGKNHGKGYAIVQGVGEAAGKYILFSDLDHAVPIITIESFLKYFNKGKKAVIGSRRVKGSKFVKRQHFLRETLGKGFTLLVKIFVDWQIKDATCGFKAFEKETAKKIFSKITIYDWAFDAELLFLCKKFKIDYVQAPVSWTDVKGSKVSVAKDVLRSFIGLLQIRFNDLQGNYK